MKKTILFIFSIVFLCSFSFAQDITITSPETGDIWCFGKSYTINWTKSGDMHDSVKIRLYNSTGTTKILNISDSTDNDGSFSWTIPASVPEGSYRIRVKTINNLVEDDSDIFRVIKCLERISTTHPETTKPLVFKKPDLTLGKFTLEPRPRYMGDRVVFRAEIKNVGEGRSGPAKAEIKITGPQGFRTLHTTKYEIPRLNPEGVHEYFLGYEASHYGIVSHMVKVDINNSNLESNEGNNEKTVSFAVNPLPGLPDLIVCLKFRDKASFCRNHTITAEVGNSGDKASQPCVLHFYVKDKGTKTYPIPILQPNQMHKIKRTHKWCKLWKTGWKTITAHIDQDKNVKEKSDNNNYVKARFKVLKYHLESGAVLKYHCSNYNR